MCGEVAEWIYWIYEQVVAGREPDDQPEGEEEEGVVTREEWVEFCRIDPACDADSDALGLESRVPSLSQPPPP